MSQIVKRVTDSVVTINHLMMPEHANYLGNVHGGVIMKFVDEAGALSAVRHARTHVVTVAIDSMTFYSPIHIGNLVTFEAHLNWVGHSSIEAEIKVVAEDLMSGELTHTNSAFVVYVAIDEHNNAVSVPPLQLETELERKRWAEAEARQAQRKLRRKTS